MSALPIATPGAPSPASPLRLPAWAALTAQARAPLPSLRELLASDPARAGRMTHNAAGLTLDSSRQRVTPAIEALLLELALQAGVPEQRDAMFRGDAINATEGRPVLHVALRGDPHETGPWGEAVQAQVQHELDRVCDFAERVRAGRLTGFSGEPLTDVVNLGIGGSDLGPRMASEALAHLAHPGLRMHYVSNPDAWALYAVLREVDPRRTLFVVSSKTFTTQETLTNAASARRWLAEAGCPPEAEHQHLVAISAAPERAVQAGYAPEQTFRFWDWVGGRYSVWSALGLPLALSIGGPAFREFLSGARAMDAHFRTAPLAHNLPVQLALMGIWNRNFLGSPTQLLAPYASRLARLTPFVQQMDMESNGKRIHTDGSACEVETGAILWGGLGIDGQHAYFQLMHQGMHRVPVDFVGVRRDDTPLPLCAEHHRVVTANLLAQARALALGRDLAQTREELQASGLDAAEAQRLAPHRTFPGNVPSNLIWLERLDPASLGALVALYEHKVFTQAAIWGIHAFDQWGVELGKKVVHEIHGQLARAA